MFGTLSDSFILAARMDAFSYIGVPANDTFLAEGSRRRAARTMSGVTGMIAAVRRVFSS